VNGYRDLVIRETWPLLFASTFNICSCSLFNISYFMNSDFCVTINVTEFTESGMNVCNVNDIKINAHLFVSCSSDIGYGG